MACLEETGLGDGRKETWTTETGKKIESKAGTGKERESKIREIEMVVVVVVKAKSRVDRGLNKGWLDTWQSNARVEGMQLLP